MIEGRDLRLLVGGACLLVLLAAACARSTFISTSTEAPAPHLAPHPPQPSPVVKVQKALVTTTETVAGTPVLTTQTSYSTYTVSGAATTETLPGQTKTSTETKTHTATITHTATHTATQTATQTETQTVTDTVTVTETETSAAPS